MLRLMAGRHWVGVQTRVLLATMVSSVACGSVCGLALHGRITVTSSSSSTASVPCCGGFQFKDVALSGKDSEFALSNVAMPSKPGLVDAFLVPLSCTKLFDGPYPGAAPLCQIYSGPAGPGGVSSRVALQPGTYRMWLQGYTSNTTDAQYLVDVNIWDHSCTSPTLQ